MNYGEEPGKRNTMPERSAGNPSGDEQTYHCCDPIYQHVLAFALSL